MQEFFTKQNAEEGVTLPLFTPDGNATQHWLKIRGVDSDTFAMAEFEAKREMMNIAQIEDIRERDRRNLKNKTVLIASLVMGWSFELECTKDNVVNFLTNAPQIREAINVAAGDRARFFKKGPPPSATGTEQG